MYVNLLKKNIKYRNLIVTATEMCRLFRQKIIKLIRYSAV